MTLNWGYLAGTAVFLAALIAFVAWQIAVNFVLGHNNCLNNVWHDDGQFRRPFLRRRIYGRCHASVFMFDERTWILVLVPRHHLGERGEYSQGRGFLLGGDHL